MYITILVKQVYWYISQVSGERLQDHWSSGNSTSRYLDDLLNVDNPYFEGMVNQIYPPELQLNKANISDTEVPVLDLHLSVANGFVSSKIYDKRDDLTKNMKTYIRRQQHKKI